MARERYLLNADEETIHSNKIELTTKSDKRKNWWHYNKTIVLVIIIVIAVIISFIYSIVSKVQPDYQIALLTSVSLPDETLTELEEYIALYGEDINGDGKVVVTINSYNLSASESSSTQDAYAQQAAAVRLTADLSEAESMIFMHDTVAFEYLVEMDIHGFFLYNNGDESPEDSEDYENMMIGWDDIKALSSFKASDYESYDSTVSGDEITEYMGRYSFSFRGLNGSLQKKNSNVDYSEASWELYQNLINDEKPVTVEDVNVEE